MNVQRLTHLRDLLIADANNPKGVKFDLGAWAGHDTGEGIPEISYDLVTPGTSGPMGAVPIKQPEPTISCNTFACALGLAALDPAFQAQGLHFSVQARGNDKLAWMIPMFEGADGFDAGARFFGISNEDSQYLFDPECYDVTPKGKDGELFVAERIEAMMNGDIDWQMHPSSADDERNPDRDEDDDDGLM